MAEFNTELDLLTARVLAAETDINNNEFVIVDLYRDIDDLAAEVDIALTFLNQQLLTHTHN